MLKGGFRIFIPKRNGTPRAKRRCVGHMLKDMPTQITEANAMAQNASDVLDHPGERRTLALG
jgi:hypothetical protein